MPEDKAAGGSEEEEEGHHHGPREDAFNHKQHLWDAKVARYLAYAVDGGILCSRFTLGTFIDMLK